MSTFNFIKKIAFVIVFQMVKFFISLRYRVKLKGLECLESTKSTLILPNHPAEIDPVMIILSLWKPFKLRPLVVEHFYYLKGFRFLMEWVRALPLPNFDTAKNKWKAKQVEKLFNKLLFELKEGENFLIYPAGKLKLTALESIGGASFVPNLLQAFPEVNIVLVRTSGLWGSRFSRALTGKVPNFGAILWEGFKIICKNGLFFTPRREVVIEIEKAGPDFPFKGSRMQVNRFLESWYNKNGPEPIKLVSDKFWAYSVPEVRLDEDKKKEKSISPMDPAIEEEVLNFIAELTKRPRETLSKEMSFSQDLGLDSLDIAGIYAFLAERYDVANVPHGQLQIIEDVMQAAAGNKREEHETYPAPSKTKKECLVEKMRPHPAFLKGKTIAEAFLYSSDRMGSFIACTDALSGSLSYKRLKMAALILSEKIKVLPGNHIGILLPSSTGTYLVILAVLLAKKVPVMLNWTTGVRSLNHAVFMTELNVVISSRRFLDRLENDLGDVEEKLQFLEELRDKISLFDKVRGWLLSKKTPNTLARRLELETISAQDPAVVIFTSGTEALPKGVPLSHENILSNQKAAMQCVCLKNTDIMYSVLPPFHSFGFSATGLLPLLMGLNVVYAPDPTNTRGMNHDMIKFQPTLFICAPGFIRSLFRLSRREDLQSLRLIVSGAEKAPSELFKTAKELTPKAQLLEGYGITECAPIVTLNRPNKPQRGVGPPIPGVFLSIIDPASLEPLEQGQEGEVCISGPNVFSGYLGSNPFNLFIEREGKRWYRSGDRGYIDAEGSLFLSGRLKRFVKIGGEMISLGGIEEELIRLAKERRWVQQEVEEPFLAVSAKENESERPKVVLYATFDVTKEEVNAALFENGFSRLAKVGEVHKVKEIPITGTGKTHHRLLDEIYASKGM